MVSGCASTAWLVMFFHGPRVALGVTAGRFGAAALLTGDTGLLPRYTITATTRTTITTGAISSPIRARCEGTASPPPRLPAVRPLPPAWRRGPATPRAAPGPRRGPPRPVAVAGRPLPGSATAGAPRAPAGDAAGPFIGGRPAGGRPAGGRAAGGRAVGARPVGRLPDSQGASWRPRVSGEDAAASNAARAAAAVRPSGRRTLGMPSPSVCADTSRTGGGGDQSPVSSIAAQAWVTVASADGSLVARTE